MKNNRENIVRKLIDAHFDFSLNQKVVSVDGKITEASGDKIVQQKLIFTTNLLLSLIENLAAGILIEDKERQVIFMNKKFCQMFEMCSSAKEAFHWRSVDFITRHIKDAEKFLQRIDEILADKSIIVNEEVKLNDDRILERDYIPIFSDQNYMGHLWLYRDVTSRKLFELELRESDRMRNAFVSNISHELRTPLTSILGFSSTILNSANMNDETRTEFIQIIHDESKRLARLVDNILDISRIEAGNMTYKKRAIFLDPIIKNVYENHQVEAKNKCLNVSYEFKGNTGKILADAGAVEQMVENLVHNAFKFTNSGGSIHLLLKEENNFLVFEIKDTGIGIPTDELGRIFKKFYRIERPNTDIPGTGIGLAIVNNIVKAHGGAIEVFSEENKGSLFRVYLPKYEQLE